MRTTTRAACRHILTVLLPLTLAACSSSSSGGGGDGGTTNESGLPPDTGVDASGSFCGHPGDMGNSLGVGQFCQHSMDCTGSMATICATAGNANAMFCTFICTAPPDGGSGEGGASEGGVAEGGAGECGENATCECQTGGCGCTPNSCLH